MDKVVVRETDSGAEIVFLKPIDDDTPDSLKQTIKQLLKSSTQEVTINMDGVRMVHTPLLGVIVFAHRGFQKKKGRIHLCNVSPRLMELFKAFGLTRVMSIAPK